MAKEIVSKSEINQDPRLAIVKAFRITNKRAGEARRADDEELLKEKIERLRELAEAAENAGFHLWVNENGRTGHTYGKDYKETPDEDNNYELYEHRINEAANAAIALLSSTGDDSDSEDSLPDDDNLSCT